MKYLLTILIFFMSFNVLAYDHSYEVTDTDENGNQIQGTIYSNNGEKNVTGDITDENGNTKTFEGQWDGYKHITGQTEDGENVELDSQ